jgi:hypothetical protein
VNVSVASGTPFDGLTLYRRNRAKLSRAKLLVFGVEDWYANASYPPSTLDRRFATLSERFGVFDEEGTLSLLGGWLWRTSDARLPLKALSRSLGRGRPKQAWFGPTGRLVFPQFDIKEFGPDVTNIAETVKRYYEPYTPGRGRFRQLAELIALARQDGLKVLLVRMPWRDAYVDAVSTSHPKELAYSELLVREMKDVDIELYARNSALGIPDNAFYDFGHLTESGTRLMSPILARRIAASLAR